MIHAAIVDDEPLARQRVRQLLDQYDDVAVVAEFGEVGSAVDSIRSLDVDLLFLDIQMPELDGFQLLEKLGVEEIPAVVFVTAHSEYALKAFDVHALDYLVKPFAQARFEETLRRARRAIAERAANSGLREDIRRFLDSSGRPGLDRLPIRSKGRIQLVPVSEIDWIEAAGNHVKVHTGGAEHLLRETLSGLGERLDPNVFVRIHRSAMVNLDRIRELQPWSHGDYLVILQDGTELVASRTYSSGLRQILEP